MRRIGNSVAADIERLAACQIAEALRGSICREIAGPLRSSDSTALALMRCARSRGPRADHSAVAQSSREASDRSYLKGFSAGRSEQHQ